MRIAIFAILIMLMAQPVVPRNKTESGLPLKITIALDKMASTEFSTIFRVICVVENTGNQMLRLVAPIAYSIEPHPWIQRDAGEERHFWSGSEICAPSFTKDYVVELRKGEKLEYELPLGSFVMYKSQRPDFRKMAVRYSFKLKGTRLTKHFDFGKLNKFTEITSEWSNEIQVPVSR